MTTRNNGFFCFWKTTSSLLFFLFIIATTTSSVVVVVAAAAAAELPRLSCVVDVSRGGRLWKSDDVQQQQQQANAERNSSSSILHHRQRGDKRKESNHGITIASTFRGGGGVARERRRSRTAIRRRRQQSSSAIDNNGVATTTTSTTKLSLSESLRRRITVGMVASALFNDMLQVSLLLPMLPDLMKHAGITTNAEIAMGIFFASKDVFQLSFAPLAGWMTNRVGGGAALLSSTMALGLATLVFAESSSSFWGLLAARSCQGAASAAVLCGGLTLVAETHPTDIRGSAMGTAYTGLGLGILCGPLIGGLLYQRVGQKQTFRIAAAVVLVNAAAQTLLANVFGPSPSPKQQQLAATTTTKKNKKKQQSDVAGGAASSFRSFANLLGNRDVLVVASSIAFVHMFLGYIKPVSQIILEEEFQLDTVARSFVITIATATCFVGTPFAGRFGDSKTIPNVRSRLLAWGSGFVALSSVFFCLRTAAAIATTTATQQQQNGVVGLLCFKISVGLIGLGLAFNRSVSSMLLADLVDRHKLPGGYGMAFALSDMADSLGLIVGPVLGLSLSQLLGTHNAGALLLGGSCLLLIPAILRIP